MTDEQEYAYWLSQQDDTSDEDYDAMMSAIYDNYIAQSEVATDTFSY